MNKIRNLLNENKVPLLIAIFQWFITTILQFDRAFFTYDNESKIFIVIKFLYLISLIISWCFIANAVKKIKNEDKDYTRGFQVFSFYFSIMMLLLLILWPGTWAWDDLWTLNSLQNYRSLSAWQHFLTGVYQDVLLQILPFPGGIIFLQNVIVSLCVAFSVTKLEKTFNIKKLKYYYIDIILKILPFLLPPVLMYQFSGYRMGLYVYLELVMLVILICASREDTEWNWKYIILFSFLTMIVSTWRTEAFVYVPCVCILLFVITKNTLPNFKKISCSLLIVLGFLTITQYQNHALKNNNYQIISLLRPCAELVRAADNVNDAEELAIIDKVTDLEIIRSNPKLNGEALYWNTECVRNRNKNPNDDYTNEDYHNYLKAFVNLSLKYPQVVINERWNLFINGTGLTGRSYNNTKGAAKLFEKNNNNNAAKATLEKNWFANNPVFKKTRSKVIYALGCMKSDGKTIKPLQRIIWNAFIPIVILLCGWIKFLLQKQWFYWIIASVVILKLLLVILTQPSSWIMYLLSFYLLGYVLITYMLWIYFTKRKEIKENE